MFEAESQNIEYKESWKDEYLKWICGFANAFYKAGFIESWGRGIGINWLLIAMCLVNVPGLTVNVIQYYKIINGTATGIWRK